MFTKTVSSDKDAHTEDLIAYAEEAMHENKWHEAAKRWQAVFQTYKNHTPHQAYVQLSVVHRLLGNYTKAAYIVQKGLKNFPDDIAIIREGKKIHNKKNKLLNNLYTTSSKDQKNNNKVINKFICLKHTFPNLYISKHVAIIGSGSSLLNQRYGDHIDTYDDIIRFNRAPTVGFEKYVGSRTTIRVVNSHVFASIPFKRGDWVQNDTEFVKRLRNTKLIYRGPDNIWTNRDKYVHKSVKCFRSIDLNVRKEIGYLHDKELSVGLLAICLCVISGIKPVIFGFEMDENRYRDHYWEKRDNISPWHSPNVEKVLLKILYDKKLIRLGEK